MKVKMILPALTEALKDDATLFFTRSDGIQAAWQLIDPILQGWESGAEAPPWPPTNRRVGGRPRPMNYWPAMAAAGDWAAAGMNNLAGISRSVRLRSGQASKRKSLP